jgi:DNA-binding PadR family transcriptional regulator
MIQVLDERTDGLWKPSPGSIYPALSLLEDEGLIVADSPTGKRQFTLTDSGREAVVQVGDAAPPWEQVTSDAGSEVVGLRDAMRQFMGAFRQVAEVGTPAQRTAAVDILNTARRQLYVLLAEEA